MWPFSGPSIADPTIRPQAAPGRSLGLLDWARRFLGGWPGPTLAATSEPGEVVRTEKAHSGPPGVVFPWFLPYVDDYTRETASIRAAYRWMWASPDVKSAILGKILAVGALDLQVRPPKKRKKDRLHHEIADFVRWSLTERLAGGVPGLTWSVLSGGLPDGYSVCEKVMAREEGGEWAGKWPLVALKPKDVGNDVILQTDSFKNVIGLMGLRYNAGQEFHPSRFLIWRNLPLYDSPTGMSDFRAAYQDWWLLDTAKKLRGMNAEKRASPWLLGHYKTASQQAGLEAILAKARSQTWAVVPEDARVEAVDLAGTADAIFADFARDCKHNIFLAIAGAILQALEGSVTDGRGNSQVHRSTADLFVWYLARAIESLLNDHTNGLIKDLVDLNYCVGEYPRATLGAVDVNELTSQLTIDTGLSGMGLELSKEETYERYGRTPPSSPDDVLKSASPGGVGGPGGGPGEPPPEAAQEFPEQEDGDNDNNLLQLSEEGGWESFAGEVGFTGEMHDTVGRKRCYHSGVQVPCAKIQHLMQGPKKTAQAGGKKPAGARPQLDPGSDTDGKPGGSSQGATSTSRENPPAPPGKVRLDPALSPRARQAATRIAAALKDSAGLTPQQKQEFFGHAQEVLKTMPEAAVERFVRNQTQPAVFVGTMGEMTEAIVKASGGSPKVRQFLEDAGGAAGCYLSDGKKEARLILDGARSAEEQARRGSNDSRTAKDTYAHEFAHAVDGPGFELSGSPEWQDAWKEELSGGKLCRYARTKPSEGFAEFGRLLYGGRHDVAAAKKAFPKCFAFWEARKLAPAPSQPAKHAEAPDRAKREGSPRERETEQGQALDDVFGGMVELPGGSHADLPLERDQDNFAEEEKRPPVPPEWKPFARRGFRPVWDEGRRRWTIGDEIDLEAEARDDEDDEEKPARHSEEWTSFAAEDWERHQGTRRGTYWVRKGKPDEPRNRHYGQHPPGSQEHRQAQAAAKDRAAQALRAKAAEANKHPPVTHVPTDPAIGGPVREWVSTALPDGVKAEDLHRLVGAPPGSVVRVQSSPSYTPGATSVALDVHHQAIDHCDRKLTLHRDGRLVCSNVMFFLKKPFQGSGMGLQVFSSQVQQLAAIGADEIVTCAGKGGGMNGFYTWPTLGYDADLDTDWAGKLGGKAAVGQVSASMAREDARKGKLTREQAKEKLDGDGYAEEARRCLAAVRESKPKTVLDVMATSEGKKVWLAMGYMTTMTFDLKEGSRSRQVLNEYLAGKGKPPIEVDEQAASAAREARREQADEKAGTSKKALEKAENDGMELARHMGLDVNEVRRAASAVTTPDYLNRTPAEAIRRSWELAAARLGGDRHAARMKDPALAHVRERHGAQAREEGLDEEKVHSLARGLQSGDADPEEAVNRSYGMALDWQRRERDEAQAHAEDWEESRHPRADDGRFGSGQSKARDFDLRVQTHRLKAERPDQPRFHSPEILRVEQTVSDGLSRLGSVSAAYDSKLGGTWFYAGDVGPLIVYPSEHGWELGEYTLPDEPTPDEVAYIAVRGTQKESWSREQKLAMRDPEVKAAGERVEKAQAPFRAARVLSKLSPVAEDGDLTEDEDFEDDENDPRLIALTDLSHGVDAASAVDPDPEKIRQAVAGVRQLVPAASKAARALRTKKAIRKIEQALTKAEAKLDRVSGASSSHAEGDWDEDLHPRDRGKFAPKGQGEDRPKSEKRQQYEQAMQSHARALEAHGQRTAQRDTRQSALAEMDAADARHEERQEAVTGENIRLSQVLYEAQFGTPEARKQLEEDLASHAQLAAGSFAARWGFESHDLLTRAGASEIDLAKADALMASGTSAIEGAGAKLTAAGAKLTAALGKRVALGESESEPPYPDEPEVHGPWDDVLGEDGIEVDDPRYLAAEEQQARAQEKADAAHAKVMVAFEKGFSAWEKREEKRSTVDEKVDEAHGKVTEALDNLDEVGLKWHEKASEHEQKVAARLSREIEKEESADPEPDEPDEPDAD